MCNYYTGFNFGQTGCGCNAYPYNICGGCARQTICRDCCGTIRVNQPCCYNHCCGNGTTQNGNGQTNRPFTCLTFCGVNNNVASTNNAGDLYYARQYGLYPYGYHRGCGCTLDSVIGT